MTAPLLLDAGRFDRQLTVKVPVEIADGCGGYTTGYSVLDSVWAHIYPTGSRPVTSGAAKSQETTHTIFIRFRHDIVPGARFVTGSRVFSVLTVHDPDETRRYLKCEVKEG